MAHVGKTSSTSRGPLSVGDGVDGTSSITTSLVSGMEARESLGLWNQRLPLVCL